MLQFGFCALLTALAAYAASEAGSTVHDVVALVRDSVKAKQTDARLAKSLHKLRLTEHLNDHCIEELVSAGAGPKSEAELEKLRDASNGLPESDISGDFPHGPGPAIEQQQVLINAARDRALAYSHSLPDFFCNEEVRRFENLRGGWQLKDTLDIKLTYFEQREKYQLLRLNGRPTVRPLESVGGAQSQGEFGSLLESIFSGESGTRFRWDHWTTLRGRLAHVFQFRILATHSRYRVEFRMGGGELVGTVTGQHGFVYIDGETNAVLKIVADADSIPRSFPVRMVHTVLDFAFTDVGGKAYLLPLNAGVRMASEYLMTRNEVAFRGYRKFGSEATITFQ